MFPGYASAVQYAQGCYEPGTIINHIFGWAEETLALIPVDLETPYSLGPTDLQYSGGSFWFATYDYNTGVYSEYAVGDLNPTSLTVSQASVVPLPASSPC